MCSVKKNVREIIFSGLTGGTHNYGEVFYKGTTFSSANAKVSYPRKTALQRLDDMKKMHDLGLCQAVMPPHERPSLKQLRRFGFSGTDQELLARVYQDVPHILVGCSSSAFMYTANSASVTSSLDSKDGKVHFTPANLASRFYRSLERKTTARVLRSIFTDEKYFTHHAPLPAGLTFSDEGSANYCRFSLSGAEPGINFFVFGKHVFRQAMPKPKYFSASQTFEASQAIARLHQLDPERTLYAQLNPLAIDSGAFHADMISLASDDVFFYHEQAFLDTAKVVEELKLVFENKFNKHLCLIGVDAHEVTLAEAARSCLFNSFMIKKTDGQRTLVVSQQCDENKIIKKCLEKIISSSDNPITAVAFIDMMGVSMNKKGPAKMGLRVLLTEEEQQHMKKSVLFDDRLYVVLKRWVEKHYREELVADDLIDPQLVKESRESLDELTQILDLGSVYEFQVL